jgi:hypothetical protein
MSPSDLPEEWRVRYDLFLQDMKGRSYEEIARHLLAELPYEWRAAYLAMTPFPTDIAIVTEGSINYQFDWHTELFADSDANDPNSIQKEARLIAAFGYTASVTAKRPSSASPEMLGFIGRTELYLGKDFDKGHYVAHTFGGSVNINLFKQARHINRGWSEEGVVYRQMEAHCQKLSGTMFFSRPLYQSPIGPPCALEFGILQKDCTLWLNSFTNSPEYQRKPRKRTKRGKSS